MFIDIHVHFRSIPGFPRHGKQAYATPEQLIERYDKLGIEKAVVLPGVSPECAYVPQSNEEVIKVARETGRFIPFCNIDPRAISNSHLAPLGDILRYYRDQGCKGIGEVTANLPFLDPKVQNLFKHVEATGLALTFHIAARFERIYGLYDDPGLPQLEESLKRFPKLKFFGHSQTFWAEMAPLKNEFDRFGYPDYPIPEEGVVPKLMRKYPNLYGDLSAGSGCNALKRDRAYAVKFMNEFQDRLMFGTDICAPDTPTPLVDFMLDLRDSGDISKTVFNKIARENAVRLLEL
ncbi:MAG: amidohydrolase family protein [Victivallaceae bacterium]|nr:amidohydrolase family protein [Victivallaceae bacterium]